VTLLLLGLSRAICRPANTVDPEVVSIAARAALLCTWTIGHLSPAPITQADNGLQSKVFLNRPGNAQPLVAVVAEAVEAVNMSDRLMLGDRVAAVEAAVAGAIEAVSTPSIASVQCGIAAAARSLESLVQAQCREMCYQKPRGSGTPTAVASVVDDTKAAVAAEDVAWAGSCVLELGCMANVVSMLVGEPGTVDGTVAR
jgi:hypothetical protein